MAWHQFFLIAGAHFCALLSPGPDFFLIVRYALVQGAAAAALASLGIALANGVFIVLAICGVSLLRSHAMLHALLYWGGCAYLAWLGLRFWRAATPDLAVAASGTAGAAHGRLSVCTLLLTGFLSGILNPKNALFYLALFTLMVGRHTLLFWQGLCGIWMFLVVLAWDCAISLAVGQPRLMARFSRHLAIVHRSSALLLWLVSGGMLLNGL
jgi:threonine/homoserine/homoserine lactone efflux protein